MLNIHRIPQRNGGYNKNRIPKKKKFHNPVLRLGNQRHTSTIDYLVAPP